MRCSRDMLLPWACDQCDMFQGPSDGTCSSSDASYSEMPVVLVPSTAVMTSPERMPAASAGPPGSGATTCKLYGLSGQTTLIISPDIIFPHLNDLIVSPASTAPSRAFTGHFQGARAVRCRQRAEARHARCIRIKVRAYKPASVRQCS
jgi:hypothetical protein